MASQWEELGKALKDVAPDIASAYCGADPHLAEAATETLLMALGNRADISTLAARLDDDDIRKSVINANIYFKKNISTTNTSSFVDIYTKHIAKTSQNNIKNMSYVIIISFMAVFLILLTEDVVIWGCSLKIFKDFPNNGPLGLILGALISAFTTVVQYFFGSSASGKQKDAMLWTSSPPK